MKVGRQVEILYDPNEPSKAIMKKGLYGMSFLTGIVGAAFAFGSLVVAARKYVDLLTS